MNDPVIVKLRLRGSAAYLGFVVGVLKTIFPIRKDSGNLARNNGRFFDRYVEIVITQDYYIDMGSGEIVEVQEV